MTATWTPGATWPPSAGLVDYYFVALYGAVGDGATDDTAAIQAAIDAAAAAGGGQVVLDNRVYAVFGGLLVSTSGIRLLGQYTLSGIYQGSPAQGSVLKRLGASTADILTLATPSGAATAISGCAVEQLSIVGNNTAAIGMRLRSVQWSTFRNLHFRNCTTALLRTEVESVIGDGVVDVQGNLFEQISGTQSTSVNGDGFQLDGTAPLGNTSVNVFNRISIQHVNGSAFKCQNCDSNTFILCAAPRTGGGTGVGLELMGSGTPGLGHARANTFIGFDAGPGGCVARAGTGGTPQASVNNVILPYSVENSGGLEPVIEATATLWFLDDLGTLNGRGVDLATVAGVHTQILTFAGSPEGAVVANIGSIGQRNDGDTRSVLQVKGSNSGGNTGWKPVHVETIAAVSANLNPAAQATTLMDATGGNRTVTLPTAVGIGGKVFRVKKSDASANTVTVQTTGGQTIEGAATVVLAAQWAFVEVQSDGANWIKI